MATVRQPPPPPPRRTSDSRPPPPPSRQQNEVSSELGGSTNWGGQEAVNADPIQAMQSSAGFPMLRKMEKPPEAGSDLPNEFDASFGAVRDPSIKKDDENKESFTAVTMWHKGFRQGMNRKGAGAPQGGMALPGMHDSIDDTAAFAVPQNLGRPPSRAQNGEGGFDAFGDFGSTKAPVVVQDQEDTNFTALAQEPRLMPPPVSPPQQASAQKPVPAMNGFDAFGPPEPLAVSQLKSGPGTASSPTPSEFASPSATNPFPSAPSVRSSVNAFFPSVKSPSVCSETSQTTARSERPRIPGWDPESVSHRKHYNPERVKISGAVTEFSGLVDFEQLCTLSDTTSDVKMNLRDIEHAKQKEASKPRHPTDPPPVMPPPPTMIQQPAIYQPQPLSYAMVPANSPLAYPMAPPPPAIMPQYQQPPPPQYYNPNSAPQYYNPQHPYPTQQLPQQQQQQQSAMMPPPPTQYY